MLGKEILKGAWGAEDKMMQATWHLTATDTSSVKVTMIGSEDGDNPNHPRTSLSQAPHLSTSTSQCAIGYHSPCSPSHSPQHLPCQHRHSRGLRLRSQSSDASASSFGSSSPTKSESDTGSSWDDSDSLEQFHSCSPDIVFLGKTEEDNGLDEEETLSLLDISNLDAEEVRKAAACQKACQSDVLYATWCDKQIREGNYEIGQHDQRVCDHADTGKRCEAPDEIGPPLTYIEECRVFRPTESINNPMGLCQFYRTSPKKSNVITGPRSADRACMVQGMLKMAKRVRHLLTVIVFKDESSHPCVYFKSYNHA